jgi:branched-chain amino acid transport system ATP-binding protein
MKLLVARGLTKRFGGIVANKSVDFEIDRGEIHAVIGPNGAGKSTFMSQLSGEHVPDQGSIVFDGRDVTMLPIHRRAQLGLGRCYQVSRVFLDHTTIDNVAMGVLARQGGHLRGWRDARGETALLDPARHVLVDVGLAGREHVPASALSHGERRQLELAMALATKPSLLLLDEPMAGMGTTESRIIVDLIAKLSATIAVVLIEHDMEAVMALADRISVLVNGRLIATGTPEAVVANSAVQEAYLASDGAPRHHA